MTRQEWNFWFKLGVGVLFLAFALSGVAYVLGWIGSTGTVLKDELGPQAAMEKYEWFVDQSAFIDKADTDIEIFRQRVADVEDRYAELGEKASWPPSTLAQFNKEVSTAGDDLVAIVSNRNSLVRDYNAASAKFNWAPFKTRQDVPAQSYEILDQ